MRNRFCVYEASPQLAHYQLRTIAGGSGFGMILIRKSTPAAIAI
jgi:hypothetical protein